MFLSKRDLINITDKALQSDKDYVLAYAVSDNKTGCIRLDGTRKELAIVPETVQQKWEANLKL